MFLLGIISYAVLLRKDVGQNPVYFVLAFVAVTALTILAMLSKETGIVLPLFCACWDFMTIPMLRLDSQEKEARPQLVLFRHSLSRSLALLLLTGVLAYWRLLKNYGILEGWTTLLQPLINSLSSTSNNAGIFYWNQNRAALHINWTARWLSIGWVWVSYVWLVVGAPFATMCCDWSAGSIPTIESWHDTRTFFVLAYFILLCGILFGSVLTAFRCMMCRVSKEPHPKKLSRSFVLSIALSFLPFLLSSNLLIPVGTLLAERLLYLPVLGFEIATATTLVKVSTIGSINEERKTSKMSSTKRRGRHKAMLVLLFASPLVGAYMRRTRERNEAWRGPIRLLESTVQTVPTNSHATLALICSIGKVGFVNRTLMAVERAASLADKLDVGEPRITYRLATVLRLTGHPIAAALFCAREERQIDEMRSWHIYKIPGLRLPTKDMADHAAAELSTARWLAVIQALPSLQRAYLEAQTKCGEENVAYSTDIEFTWSSDAWRSTSLNALNLQLHYLTQMGVFLPNKIDKLNFISAPEAVSNQGLERQNDTSWTDVWSIVVASARAVIQATRLFPIKTDLKMEKSIISHGKEIENFASKLVLGATDYSSLEFNEAPDWDVIRKFLHEAC